LFIRQFFTTFNVVMIRGFIAILALCCANSVLAQVIEIQDARDEQVFTLNDLKYFIDSTNSLSIQDIIKPEIQDRFKRHDSYVNTDYRTDATYWVRFPVYLPPGSNKVWMLEFYDQTIDHLEVFQPTTIGFGSIQMGDQFPFYSRRFRHKNFDVQLQHVEDSILTYYFKIRSHEFADIRVAVRSTDRFIPRANVEYFLYGTFYGMMLIISLYNFLVYLAIREIKNIIYIAYLVSVAFYAMSLDGIGFQYLWPGFPQWNDYASGIALYSVILWALVFTRRFLSTRANAPRLDKILKWIIVARSALFLTAMIVEEQLFGYRIIDIIPLMVIFYTGVRVWYNGYRPARFFVIAYGILFLGFFIRFLVYLNVIPFSTPSHYSLHFSFVLEMLFLTFALGDRIRILKNMRDRALKRIIHQHEVNMLLKDKVNRELEQKVQERTEELNSKNHQLEESNQKLVRQAFEINQINSILDLDNWKLKNSIKEVLNERLLEKTMNYEQFQTIYPDRLACYRFLETLKWEKEFVCRKCKNQKYFKGTPKFARRCTRCGYNESITAFTIFHSIKFPIEKAFYIAYLTVTGKQDYTLEALANKLEVGTNTVWSFRMKVSERINELARNGKRLSASRWEEIILEPVRRKRINVPSKPESTPELPN
jgi:two-component system, sensor histidine kinase LadS